jgi:tetratricopeptide (TPR) repeat protein
VEFRRIQRADFFFWIFPALNSRFIPNPTSCQTVESFGTRPSGYPCKHENLARTLRKAGKLEEAEQLARTALARRERVLGSKHSDTCGNMATLADILRDKGDAPGAVALYDQALEGLQQSLGPAHPDTLIVLYEYSLLRKNQRQDIEARRLTYQLVAGARRTLPQNHPDRAKYEQLMESVW